MEVSVQDGLKTNIWIIVKYIMPVYLLKSFINFVILMMLVCKTNAKSQYLKLYVNIIISKIYSDCPF